MRHEPSRIPQFYVTAPQKCPYIKGKVERKLFTALYGTNSVDLNDELSLQGFRRSQKVLYRPLCSNCSACLSIRVKVNEFNANRIESISIQKNRFEIVTLICLRRILKSSSCSLQSLYN